MKLSALLPIDFLQKIFYRIIRFKTSTFPEKKEKKFLGINPIRFSGEVIVNYQLSIVKPYYS